MSAIETAIERAGGVAALARAIGVKHPSVIKWRTKGRIPAERVHAIAAAAKMCPSELRPDLFGKAARQRAIAILLEGE